MICAQCHTEKSQESFRKRGTLCRDCYTGNELSAKKIWAMKHGAQSCREWRKRNPEKVVARGKVYRRRSYLKNREKLIARSAKYRAENREKHRAYTKKWIAEHKEQYAIMNRANQHSRRVKFGAYKPTKASITQLLSEWNGLCSYCAKEIGSYHVDHILPVSKGGTNHVSNLAIVCKECNWSKRDKTLAEWAALKSVVLYKSSLIDSEAQAGYEAEGISHRERLSEKTQKWDATVRTPDIN